MKTKKEKRYNEEFISLLKEQDSYIDDEGNVTDEKYHEISDRLKEMALIIFGLDDILDEIRGEIKDVIKSLKTHTHQKGTVYVKL